MNCEVARDIVLDALDGSVDSETRRLLDRHLAECAACQEFARAQYALDIRLAAALPPAVPSPALRVAVRANLPSRASIWADSLPDVAHVAGCALGVALLIVILPQYAGFVLQAGGAFTLVTFFLQAVLRSSLERLDPNA
jgi:predicted anti-sigma-YlaC factor YlaD